MCERSKKMRNISKTTSRKAKVWCGMVQGNVDDLTKQSNVARERERDDKNSEKKKKKKKERDSDLFASND